MLSGAEFVKPANPMNIIGNSVFRKMLTSDKKFLKVLELQIFIFMQ